LWGFAAGASTGSFSVPDRSTNGTVDGGHVGLYGVARSGPLYLFSDLAYAYNTNQTNRIAATGILPTEVETGHFGSNLVSGRIETGWRQFYGTFGVTPFAALDFYHLWQPAYTENSATTAGAPGILGLSYASEQVTSLPFALGAQLDYKTPLPNAMTWSQYVRGSWVYELASTARAITPAFEVAPTVPFAIDGAAEARNAARIDAGTTFKLSARAELFGNFTGEFSNVGQSYAGTGGLRVSW
jgi:outer membrane autotransporter protein